MTTETREPAPGDAFAVGVDVGGTHTDLILSGPSGLVRSKAFTTHGNYSQGIFDALEIAAGQVGLTAAELLPRTRAFVNGSTIVTNAITELRGAKVGVLITRGFRDTFRLAGGARSMDYDDHAQVPPPDVVERDCIEEVTCVRHKRKAGIEIRRLREPPPEFLDAVSFLELRRRHVVVDPLGPSVARRRE